ncbi:hypothetical protein TRVA0_012S00386 [Trichomonascus vanleenenianus]|uniref:uncharacterized protein n=1 Tax=Trichomonascus vanleenenianus TaxID=2268995 RepID=UPI003ECB723C
MSSYNKFPLYKVEFVAEGVLHVQFNRAKALNAVHPESFRQYKQIFDIAEHDPEVRVIVLSGDGRAFCAGLDVKSVAQRPSQEDVEAARKAIHKYYFIREFQEAISRPHTIIKPVIAVAHGPSIGLAIDILSACDIRYASKDALFSIRETDIGMAADIGTLQRMPKIVNNLGWFKEIAYTARNFGPDEAKSQGFVDRVFDTKATALHHAVELAKEIASKSPVAVHGTKKSINYAIDHTHADSLEQIAEFNAHGVGHDMLMGAMAALKKEKVKYAKL